MDVGQSRSSGGVVDYLDDDYVRKNSGTTRPAQAQASDYVNQEQNTPVGSIFGQDNASCPIRDP